MKKSFIPLLFDLFFDYPMSLMSRSSGLLEHIFTGHMASTKTFLSKHWNICVFLVAIRSTTITEFASNPCLHWTRLDVMASWCPDSMSSARQRGNVSLLCPIDHSSMLIFLWNWMWTGIMMTRDVKLGLVLISEDLIVEFETWLGIRWLLT